MKGFCTLIGGTSLLALAGCSLHSIDLAPSPIAQTGSSYSVSDQQTKELLGGWYESFKDPALTELIEMALQNNMDVRQALARVKQADALVIKQHSGIFPNLSAQASDAREWEGRDQQENLARAGVALSWEIDAFNRIGAQTKARRYEQKAAEADMQAVRLALSAEIAEAYFSAIAQSLQIHLLEDQAEVDGKLLDLIDQRFKAGVGTNVEVLQQKSQLAENQSLIPPAEAALRVYENRLDVLLGQAPDAQNLTGGDDVFADIGPLPALGVPSDLLLNRPDVLAAKDRLIAADAEIGAALADRLPRLTLTGSSLYTDGGAGLTTSALAGLVQPLIDWGSRRAEVSRNKAVYEERLAAFTKIYLEAIEDVENALYQEDRQREYIKRLETRRAVLDQTLSAARAVYEQGESDYLPVLDSIQNLRVVERNLISQQLNLVLYRIQLFRALGAPISNSPIQEPS